ncbi:hypothetical protein LTR36_005575 [Oleoguttula mirabilis]|uniref:F-box domain-containing protein n=1 Tax=Oleoguttula mirabilis TaxID=1507867 RepID=A0AAV9JDZ3_9PEZI|nr:hypothetical protein LTR36_005575 [Oleoguttula mirabilis]
MPHPRLIRYAELQPRISELMAQSDELMAQDTTQHGQDSMSGPPHPRASLLGLPAELRTYIYELAVFHEPSDGIISPLSDISKQCMILAGTSSVAGEDKLNQHWSAKCLPDMPCERFKLSKSHGAYELSHPATGLTAELESEHDYKEYLFSTTANAEWEHFCTLDCLLQPSITKVNSLVREESLRAFYSVNHFHFEMHNFHVKVGQKTPVQQGSPPDWWRACGDTNLRMIRHLSVVGHPISTVPERGVMIIYDKRRNTVSIVNKEEGSPTKDDDDEDAEELAGYAEYVALAPKDPAAEIRVYLNRIQESGLHVRVLECMLAALEPFGELYLRDRSALE